jgi:hypothetical protein
MTNYKEEEHRLLERIGERKGVQKIKFMQNISYLTTCGIMGRHPDNFRQNFSDEQFIQQYLFYLHEVAYPN